MKLSILSIKDILQQTLNLYKKYFKEMLAFTVLLIVLSLADDFIGLMASQMSDANLLKLTILLLQVFISVLGTYSFIILILIIASLENNKRASIRTAAQDGLRRLVPYLLVGLLQGLIFLLGLVLLVIPAFIFFSMYSMAIYFAILENKSPIESMKLSKKITKGHRISILIVLLLFYIPLGIMGVFLIGIGSKQSGLYHIFSIPMELVSVASILSGYVIYRMLKSHHNALK